MDTTGWETQLQLPSKLETCKSLAWKPKPNHSVRILGKTVVTQQFFFVFVGPQGPELNGYLVGRGNANQIDLNRNFPDLNALMYYYEKTNGRNHHLPLPDNWELQVRNHIHKTLFVYANMCGVNKWKNVKVWGLRKSMCIVLVRMCVEY